MFRGKIVHLILGFVLYSNVTVFGQWSAANSGTTNNLNGAYLLDSGIAFVVGDAGTILKSTDAGATWAPLTSGTTNALHDVYLFDELIYVLKYKFLPMKEIVEDIQKLKPSQAHLILTGRDAPPELGSTRVRSFQLSKSATADLDARPGMTSSCFAAWSDCVPTIVPLLHCDLDLLPQAIARLDGRVRFAPRNEVS
jgi:hypothetical protein